MRLNNENILNIFVDYIPEHTVKELTEKYDHLIMGSNLCIVRYYELYSYNVFISYYDKHAKTFFVTNQRDLCKSVRKHIGKAISIIKDLIKLDSSYSLDRSMDLSNFIVENFDHWRIV